MSQRPSMEYLAPKDDGVDDDVKFITSRSLNPQEDSRTATFSLKGFKRSFSGPEMPQDQGFAMQKDEPEQSAKRQRTETKIPNYVVKRMQEDPVYRKWAEEERIPGQHEPPTVASTRSRRFPKLDPPTKRSKAGPSTGPRSTSMDGAEEAEASTFIPAPLALPSGQVYPQRIRVKITGVAKKATLKEFEVIFKGFDHEPLIGFTGPRKKEKNVKHRLLIVTFRSLPEAQRAIKELNGSKLRSRKLSLVYDSGPESVLEAAEDDSLSHLLKAPRVSEISEILSDDEEEGEIDESAPAESTALPDVGSAEELHQAELINGAARQVAARLSKNKFRVDRVQQNFHEGIALLLSVSWPRGANGVKDAKLKVNRETIRRRLYGIIPLARFDTIETCFEPRGQKPCGFVQFIVVYRSPEATKAAEQYLNAKEFTEQDINFTIEVGRSADIKESPATKKPDWQLVPKGTERENLAIGIAGVARKEIAQGLYTTKKFLIFGSNPNLPLIEEKARPKKPPSILEDEASKQNIVARAEQSKIDQNASENFPPTTTTSTTPITPHTTQDTPTMATSSSLTDLPIPVRSFMSQLSEHERKLQTKYNFIERDEEVVFCPLCNNRGHMNETCPERTCRYCGEVDAHFDQECPNNQKCGKCKERGHNEMVCTAKLRRTTVDGFEDCDICGRDGHPEEQCPDYFVLLFKPPVDPNKVESVRVGCYVCASQQHFGDDCPDRNTMGRKRAPLGDSMHIFTTAFANKFLTTPLPPAVRFEYREPIRNGRPPVGYSQPRGGRHVRVNARARHADDTIDLEFVQDSLDNLPRRAQPRQNSIPPPPREPQPPLPPGPPPPPPPSLSRRRPPPPPRNLQRGNDGYVQYQPQPSSHNDYSPSGQYQHHHPQDYRRRSRSPERRRGNGFMGQGRNTSYRDRDGVQQSGGFPRGSNNHLRGPPDTRPPGMGGYSVRR